MKKILTVCCTILVWMTCLASTNVPNTISTNQVWTVAGSPYIITDSTTILKNISIKIMPGVTVSSEVPRTKFIVNGELLAMGTKDSSIDFVNVSLDFREDSKNYDILNQGGCYFEHCSFNNSQKYKGANVGFQNCVFKSGEFGSLLSFVSSPDSASIIADSCSFFQFVFTTSPITSPSWSHIWPDKNYFKFDISNSTIERSYWSIQGDVSFKNNYVNEADSSHFYIIKQGEINCNTFKNVTALHLDLDTFDNGSFSYNTLDSVGARLMFLPTYGMLNIHTSTSLPNFSFSYNNFLNLIQNSNWPLKPTKKVAIQVDSALNRTFGLDFSNCYWGTTSFKQIDSFKYDKKDTSGLKSTIISTPFLLKPRYTCSPSPKCQASFYFGVDTTVKDELFIIENSRGVDSRTKYFWTFGDGNESQDRTPTHTYSKAGTYIVCLTISTADTSCSSSFCDTIYANVNPFKIIVRDGKNSSIEPITNATMVVYPNPNNGTFTINTNTPFTHTINVSLLDKTGRRVYTKTVDPTKYSNGLNVDASTLVDGVYFVIVESNDGIYSQKIVVVH